jgi:hypothetical protein
MCVLQRAGTRLGKYAAACEQFERQLSIAKARRLRVRGVVGHHDRAVGGARVLIHTCNNNNTPRLTSSVPMSSWATRSACKRTSVPQALARAVWHTVTG